jgi:hypothetical protein
MKTSDMKDLILDWAVATANGDTFTLAHQDWAWYSTDWAFGGPIIEREGISVCYDIELSQDESRSYWATIYAVDSGEGRIYGPTPLIAAMRCFVASKLGDDIDVPKELT